MQKNFIESRTKENLMRAFAGESQARNRYSFAQKTALEQNMYAISEIFRFTAEQEEQHAKIFFDLLKDATGTTVEINAGYPADVYGDIQKLLDSAVHNENEEFSNDYPAFAQTAQEEGFAAAASRFNMIAQIENQHRLRFEYYANLLRSGNLHKSEKTERWLCLNCGHIHESSEAPVQCPVCGVNRGYFIRENEASFTGGF